MSIRVPACSCHPEGFVVQGFNNCSANRRRVDTTTRVQ